MELSQVKNVSELFIKFMPDINMHDAQKLYTTIGFQCRLFNVIKSNKKFECINIFCYLINKLILINNNE